jgi:hypothetical protein
LSFVRAIATGHAELRELRDRRSNYTQTEAILLVALVALTGEGRLLRAHATISWPRAIGRLAVTWMAGSFVALAFESLGPLLLQLSMEQGK